MIPLINTIRNRAAFRVFNSEVPPSNTPPVTDPNDNSVIREMRAEIDRLKSESQTEKAARIQAEQKATELERAKMDDLDRTKSELAEAKSKLTEAEKAQAEVARYQVSFETLYNQELANAPETARENLKAISSQGSWPDRLDTLRKGLELIPAEQRKVAGSNNNPAGGGPAGGGAPVVENTGGLKFDAAGNAIVPSWNDILKKDKA